MKVREVKKKTIVWSSFSPTALKLEVLISQLLKLLKLLPCSDYKVVFKAISFFLLV